MKRIKLLLTFILVSILLISCNNKFYHNLNNEEKSKILSGETYIYQSNLGRIDTLHILSSRKFYIPNSHYSSVDYYETHQIIAYLNNDIDSIYSPLNKSELFIPVSSPIILTEEERKYQIEIFHSHIEGFTFQWKEGNIANIFTDEVWDEFELHDTAYTNVYIIRPVDKDEVFDDSIKLVQKVYYSVTDGILKYFYSDNETFTLIEKLN